MATITFDTLKFANQLKEAGIPPAQAEAEAKALPEVLEINLQNLSTWEDVQLVRKDMEAMEKRLDDKLTMREQRMTIKLGTLMVLAIGIVATLVKLL